MTVNIIWENAPMSRIWKMHQSPEYPNDGHMKEKELGFWEGVWCSSLIEHLWKWQGMERRNVKCYLSGMTWEDTHALTTAVVKSYTKPSWLKFQLGLENSYQGPTPAQELLQLIVAGGRESHFSLGTWPVVGCSCFSGWSYTHMYIWSTQIELSEL